MNRLCVKLVTASQRMLRRVSWSKRVWVLAFCAICGRSEAAQFIGLGKLPGGDRQNQAFAVSADGSVVVGLDSGSGFKAFRWTSGGGMVGLGDLAGGEVASFGNAVSADGSVAVGQGTSASGVEAFRWTSGGGMVGLGVLAGGVFSSQATAVSADGSVVVGSSSSVSGGQAIRWTSGSGMVGLGDLAGGAFFSRASGVSADGSVVVGYSESGSGVAEAFRWTSGGGMVGLGDLADGLFTSQAFAISADGSVVVGLGSSASGFEAFRWTSGGGMVGLGDIAGGGFGSQALAVSADGSVAVGQGTSASGLEASIWDATGGMQSLTDVLSPSVGAALNGWTLTEATAISADGRTVVGSGTNPNGDTEAWLAYLADEIYWFPNASGGWDSPLSWSGPSMPGSADDVVIDPTTALTVTGPGASQTVGKLTLGGSGASRVTLRLDAGSLESLTSATFHADSELMLADGRVLSAPGLSNSGLIRGTGTLNTDLTNNTGGEVRVAADQSLVVSGASHTSAGKLEVIGGSLEFIGAVTNDASTGLIAGENATLRFNDGLANDGSLAVSFGTSRIFGDVTNAASGSIVVAGNSNATFYDDVTNGGALNVAAGSTAVFFGALTGNGNVGSGDVQALGDLRPGASPGLMQFGGDLTLGPLTNFAAELGGLVAGNQFDQLVVAGDAVLAGTLAVSLIEDFTLSAGDSFEIVDVAGALAGTFAGLAEGATVGNLSGLDLFITYAGGDGNDVALFTLAPVLPGDYNENGVVDAADYTVWRDHLGAPAGTLPNDVDGGAIGLAQYATWKANFGATFASGSASVSTAVPEPNSVALAAIILLGPVFAGTRLWPRE